MNFVYLFKHLSQVSLKELHGEKLFKHHGKAKKDVNLIFIVLDSQHHHTREKARGNGGEKRLSNAPLLIKGCVSIFTDDSSHKTKCSSSITPPPTRADVYFFSPFNMFHTLSQKVNQSYAAMCLHVSYVEVHPQDSPGA